MSKKSCNFARKYMKRWYLFYFEQVKNRQQLIDELEMSDKPIVRWAWLHTKSSRSSNVPFSKTN